MTKTTASQSKTDVSTSVIRQHAEQEYAEELAAIREEDVYPKPENWLTSPKMTLLYLLEGKRFPPNTSAIPNLWRWRSPP